jgi:hypothetical protein
VEHQVVAVGVGEERHLADAGVERLATEDDARGLELGPGGCDVIDVKGEVGILLGGERDAEPAGLPDPEARLTDPELEAATLVRPEAERVDVEGAGPLGVGRRYTDEVQFLEDGVDPSSS